MEDFGIHGIDLGNYDIKTDKYTKFPNKVSTKVDLLNPSDNFMFQQTPYVLGEGSYQTDYNKASKENILVTLFGALAIDSTSILNKVAIGLPIQHYKEQKETLKHIILNNRIQDIEYKGKAKRLIIEDVEVFPEGVSAYHSLSYELKAQIGEEDLVIIDIGGRTTNICLFNVVRGARKIVQYQTIPVGMLNIYDDFIQAINSKYTLDKTLDDGYKIFTTGLSILGVKQDLTFTKPLIKQHVDKIFQELNINFPIATSQVLLVGGGSLMLQNLFRKKLPHIVISNEPIFGNAIGYKKVGESIWLKRQ